MRTVKSEIRVGLIGLGTVGSGVVEILSKHQEDFRTKTGVDVVLAKAADRDESRAQALGLPAEIACGDASLVIDDPDIDIVIELVGGINPAKDFVLRALKSGKNVVTANKALMATHGKEIMEEAEAAGVDIAFEASVGGGIPIIHPLKESLAANEIEKVIGIVNGTTNFILSEMAEQGILFEEALAEAQRRGYAEADPTADVDGLDAAAKIAILASIAFNSRTTSDRVFTEGIRKITPSDIAYARDMGYAIKLLAIAARTAEGIDVRVHPTMIPLAHPLASVNGVYNAIYVVGDSVGDVMFYGQGAGSLPAASAVVGDVIDVARRLAVGNPRLIGCTCFFDIPIRDHLETRTKHYVRMRIIDKPGVLAQIAKTFGDNEVSIESVIQKEPSEGGAELVFVTHVVKEKNLQKALSGIERLEVVNEIANHVRVEG
ncbi:MAG: homoserine dehydrogenase [Actinobacteria bacterium]|nr:homoserine dehydrogenase [Actinomycetota bacterium]